MLTLAPEVHQLIYFSNVDKIICVCTYDDCNVDKIIHVCYVEIDECENQFDTRRLLAFAPEAQD